MIYLITVIKDFKYEDKFKWYKLGGYRTVGYITDLDMAIDLIKNNNADIWETCYDYAIVEGIPEGYYPECDVQLMFKFNVDKLKYEEMTAPENFFCGYSKIIG